jgi:PAS domain S-box-containing protein
MSQEPHATPAATPSILNEGSDEEQSLLAAIVESSQDAVIIKSLDGIILSWNAGAERLFGYRADEAIGSAITLMIPPDKLAEEKEIFERLRHGETIDHFETVRVTKEGRRIDISLSISPVRDPSGQIIGASKVARDITEQKQAQAALVALKDELSLQLADLRRLHGMSVRLSTTLDLQPILDETLRTAATIEGAEMGLLSLYDAEHDRLEIGSSLGFSEEFLKSVDRLPPLSTPWGACLQRLQPIVMEDVEADAVSVSDRDICQGAGFRAIHSTPLITREGKVAGVLSIHFRRPHCPSDREIHLVDLCARHAVAFIENARLYDELRETDRRKDEFLATLAHELRNPLAPISNALQILRLSDDLTPEVEHVRGIMERQVNHMVRLVDDLLEVSRITRGKIELRSEKVQLVSVLRSAIETSRPLIDAAGHQLAISIAPEALLVEADPVRLAQVVANLLNNAAKYTEKGGQIWLTARREGSEAAISVRDNGMGIPRNMLPRVFDMFAQMDRTLKRAQGGLGIGLALAKRLVQMQGGRIEVKSAGQGQGSEFIVRLPLSSSAPELAPPADAAEAHGVSKLARRKILVVDDARDSAHMLGRLLEHLGQTIQVASDGPAGLAAAQAAPPDLIISDIGMPGMDGYELARRLRRLPELNQTLLVALTGYGQDSDRKEAFNAGFNFHLVKPVSFESLQMLLESLPAPRDAAPREEAAVQRE